LPVAIFAVRRMDVRFEQRVNVKFKHNVTVLPHPPYSPDLCPCDFFSVFTTEKKAKRTATWEYRGYSKRLRRWSSQAFRKRHSPAAFRTCRNTDKSVLTAEGTTSKGTGSISCEVEFCIFYRLGLKTLRTKDVFTFENARSSNVIEMFKNFDGKISCEFNEKLKIIC
jgi:hypothetical protein